MSSRGRDVVPTALGDTWRWFSARGPIQFSWRHAIHRRDKTEAAAAAVAAAVVVVAAVAVTSMSRHQGGSGAEDTL